MAQFCTKCGTALTEGMRFCTGCGATIDGPTAPPPPAAPPPDMFTPVAPAPAAPRLDAADVVMTPSIPVPPAAPAPAKGGSGMKIVLIIVGVFLLLGMLMVGSCVFGIYRAHQRLKRFEKQVQTTFPVTPGSSQAPIQPGEPGGAAVDAGALAYPGAETPGGQTGAILGMAGLKMQQFTTSDSVDKVVAFYKDKLGPNAVVAQGASQASVHLAEQNSVVNVAIAADSASGKTKIVITSIGK